MDISPNATDIPNFPTMNSAIIIQLCAEKCFRCDIQMPLINIIIHDIMIEVSPMVLDMSSFNIGKEGFRTPSLH